MAKVNLVTKKTSMELADIIRYQLVDYCYFNKIPVVDSYIDCLVLLALKGSVDIADFCTIIIEKRIFKNTQTVRNCLIKLEKNKFIVTGGKKYKKVLTLNPDMKIQTVGNILLDYKILHLATTES